MGAYRYRIRRAGTPTAQAVVHNPAHPTGFCMSTTATRPPGRVTATITDTASGQLGISDEPQVLMTASKPSPASSDSASGAVASASINNTLFQPAEPARRRAWCSIWALASTAVIDPVGPIPRCRWGKFNPVPHPMSGTRSPGRSAKRPIAAMRPAP